MINVTQAVEDAILDGQDPHHLVEINFEGITLFLTDAATDLQFNGEAWISGGLLLDPSSLDLVNEVRTVTDSIVITGVDQAVKSLILNDPSRQAMREVVIYECFLNTQGQIIPDPYIRDIYFIDSVQMIGGVQADTISLQLAGEFADFDYKAGIRTTNASMQRVHSGDRFMQFSKAAGKPVKWGGK